MQNLSCENEFYLHDNKKSFSQERFALGLVLNQRLDLFEYLTKVNLKVAAIQ